MDKELRDAIDEAVAGVGWSEDDGYILIFIARDGQVRSARGIRARDVRGVLERTAQSIVELLYAEPEPEPEPESQSPFTPDWVQQRAWGWEAVLPCPDGEMRLFKAKNPKTKPKREQMRIDLRWSILQRDAFTCRYCGRKAPDVELHVDHVIPVIKGGTDDPANLVTACFDCNVGKKDRSL